MYEWYVLRAACVNIFFDKNVLFLCTNWKKNSMKLLGLNFGAIKHGFSLDKFLHYISIQTFAQKSAFAS